MTEETKDVFTTRGFTPSDPEKDKPKAEPKTETKVEEKPSAKKEEAKKEEPKVEPKKEEKPKRDPKHTENLIKIGEAEKRKERIKKKTIKVLGE